MQEGSKKKQNASDWQERSKTLLFAADKQSMLKNLGFFEKEKPPGTTM